MFSECKMQNLPVVGVMEKMDEPLVLVLPKSDGVDVVLVGDVNVNDADCVDGVENENKEGFVVLVVVVGVPKLNDGVVPFEEPNIFTKKIS